MVVEVLVDVEETGGPVGPGPPAGGGPLVKVSPSTLAGRSGLRPAA